MSVPRWRPEICTVDGCDKRHHARGFCAAHYTRQLRGQDIFAVSNREHVARISTADIVRLYVEDQWSTLSISRRFKIADVTVSAILKRNGISIRTDYLTRPRTQSRIARAKLDENFIVATYKAVSDIGVLELARLFNASGTTIKTILLDHGVKLRTIKEVRHKGKFKRDPNITDEQRISSRHGVEIQQWRLAVFKRDKFECQSCGMFAARAGLEAHHIENWSSNPDKRFVVSNGITFCKRCHVVFHQRFGYRNNDRVQLAAFLSPAVEIAA